MSLVLYNTLSKKEEEFIPLQDAKVAMYTCGPTVYGRPHIGNYSSFLMADLLRRWLEVSGFEVTHVKNITDVGHLVADQDEGEDKVEREAKKERVDPLEIARRYTEQYLEDEKALNMLEPQHRPRATETIPEMIAMVEVLLNKGHAYETEDGVYFAVETFPDYGALSGNTIENLEAGARVDVKEEKRHPADFALWKKCVGENAEHVLRWDSPWGEGFPGWHIECSAMSTKFLGEQIDIHTGGEDNIFPHHECEIAQSECSSGKKPFVRFWLHRRRIDMGAEKMSKSLGNVLSVPDIVEKGYDPLDLRYYFLSVHYRTNLKFSWKGMDDAHTARRKIVQWISNKGIGAYAPIVQDIPEISVADVTGYIDRFTNAMDDDLNTPAALASVFDAINHCNKSAIPAGDAHSKLRDFISMVQETFGCFDPEGPLEIPAEVQELLRQREQARGTGDFETSDRLRDEIREKGFEVRDMDEGQIVERM